MRLALCLPFALLAASAPAHADTITFLVDRKPQVNVSVIDERLDVIEYRLEKVNQKQTVKSDEVAEVVYEGLSEEYLALLDDFKVAFAKEDYKSVAQQLVDNALSERRKGLAAQGLLKAADAYQFAGEIKAAVETLDRLVKDQPQSRYAPIATLEKGRLLAASGDAANARASFLKLREFGERWQIASDLQIQIAEEAKDPAAALEAYRGIVTKAASFPSIANEAKLRIGRVMIANKKHSDAIAAFQGILDARQASSRRIQAGAWNGFGAALAAKPDARPEDLKQALYAHLRVITQFDDVPDEQPEALYRAGKMFQRVEAQDAAMRARQLFSRCQKDYPGSEWAKLAAQG
jgi:tetratricopeptide (TPR) repeat protein